MAVRTSVHLGPLHVALSVYFYGIFANVITFSKLVCARLTVVAHLALHSVYRLVAGAGRPNANQD